jgi:hypothetical protein
LRLFCAIQTCAFLVHHDQGAIANAVAVPPVPRLAVQQGAFPTEIAADVQIGFGQNLGAVKQVALRVAGRLLRVPGAIEGIRAVGGDGDARVFAGQVAAQGFLQKAETAAFDAKISAVVERLAGSHADGAAQRGEGSGCRPEAPVDFDPLQAIRQQGVEVGDPRQRIGNRQAIQRHESLPAGSPQVKDSETVRAALGDGDTRLAAQDFVDGAFVGDGQAGFVVDIGMPAGRGEIRDFSGRRLDDYRGQGSGFERIGRD